MEEKKILCIQDFKDNAGNIIFTKNQHYAFIFHKNINKIIIFTQDDWELPIQLDLELNLDYLKKSFKLPIVVKRRNIIKYLINPD